MQHISRFKKISVSFFIFVAAIFLVLDSIHVSATVPYITERVNLTPAGSQTISGNVQEAPSISQDGRYIAFATTSSDIVAGDTNNMPDVFVRDRKLSSTVRANLSSTGAQLSSGSGGYRMSPNGRYITFSSDNASVVPGDTNGQTDLFLRDLKTSTTEMISLPSTGGLPNSSSASGDISADGRYVVFTSWASNLVPGDTNGTQDIFIRDRKLGTTTIVSNSSSGTPSNDISLDPVISCDGAYVAYFSYATNLVSGDTNGVKDIFLVDRVANDFISNITVNGNGTANGVGIADISCNGETLAFSSRASNLVSGDTNGATDIFTYSILHNSFQRVNLDSSGNQTLGNVPALNLNSLDFSGRYIVFASNDDSLVSGDINNNTDLFLRDLIDGTTQKISQRSVSVHGTGIGSTYYSLSLDGREVIYPSSDSALVTGDTNGIPDIFVSKTGI